MNRISHSDIVRNFRIADDARYEWPAPGFELRDDGVFVKPASAYRGLGLTPEEEATLTAHPTGGGFDDPALKIPCTPIELAVFMLWAGCEDLLPEEGSEFRTMMQRALETARAIEAAQPESTDVLAALPAKPLPLQRWQEREILRVIHELGLEANAFPKNPPGKRGAKSEVRDRLKQWQGSVFNRAWERLRKEKVILDRND